MRSSRIPRRCFYSKAVLAATFPPMRSAALPDQLWVARREDRESSSGSVAHVK